MLLLPTMVLLLAKAPMLALTAMATRRVGGIRMSSSPTAQLPPLLDASGAPLNNLDAFTGKRVGYYFTAGWCPMCTDFERKGLLMYREAAKEAGKPIELIMVSSDRSEKDALARAQSLDMLQVSYDGDHRGELKKQYKVWAGSEVLNFGMGRRSGVPAIVVLDSAGEELAFVDAEASGAKSLAKWPQDEGIW